MNHRTIAPRADRTLLSRLPVVAVVVMLVAGCAHCKKPAPAPAATSAAAVPKTPKPPAAEEPANVPKPVMDQRALDRLKQMSEMLASAHSLSYRSRSMAEVPASTGQNLTFFTDAKVVLQRPNRLRAEVTGDVPHFQILYDGSRVSALDLEKNLYAVTDAPSTVDETLKFLMDKSGIHFPASEVLFSDPYAVMSKDVNSAFIVGPSQVDGFRCDHLAFMGPGVNWEIWIDSGSRPVPRRLAVTYKEVTNFPRFLLEFSNWNLNPKLSAGTFVFKKPATARQIEFASRAEAEVQQMEKPK